MATLIRKKLATVVILFLQYGLTNGTWHFYSDGFDLPEDKKVVVSMRIEDRGVTCDPDSVF